MMICEIGKGATASRTLTRVSREVRRRVLEDLGGGDCRGSGSDAAGGVVLGAGGALRPSCYDRVSLHSGTVCCSGPPPKSKGKMDITPRKCIVFDKTRRWRGRCWDAAATRPSYVCWESSALASCIFQ
jgi:hypothetical protein